MKSGGSLILSVNVTGAPTPSVSWYLGQDQLQATNGISIETTDTYSTLTVKDVKDNQGGVYSVLAENSVGSDKAEFTVNIRGGSQLRDSTITCVKLIRLSLVSLIKEQLWT